MARFINPFPQFILANGSPNSGGIIKFFDNNTDNPKDVFSDAGLTQSIGSEIRLKDDGSVPDVFLNGAYRVRVFTSNGQTQTHQADNIGIDTSQVAFNGWQSSVTYGVADIVTGSDDRYYRSIVGSNQGNDPVTQPSAFWEEVLFYPVWNNAQTYRQGELSLGSNGRAYQSQSGSNQGNDPTLDATNWKQIVQVGDSPNFNNITLNKTDVTTSDIDWNNDTTLRWRFRHETNENLTLNRYDSGGVFQEAVITFSQSSGALNFATKPTFNTDVDIIGGDFLIDKVTAANAVSVTFNGAAAQQKTIAIQDAGNDRWVFGQTSANVFSFARYDAAGVLQDEPFFITGSNGQATFTNNLNLQSSLNFENVNNGIDVTQAAAGSFTFNFSGVTTENVAFDFFDNSNTSGTRLIDVYKGDGTSTVTFEINADDGSIHTAKDQGGVKLGKITLSTLAPSGGNDGDLWFRY